MPADATPPPAPVQTVQVFAGNGFRVTLGVNIGDGLGPPDEVCPGDIYRRDAAVSGLKLALRHGPSGETVAEGSGIGTPGSSLSILATYTLMAGDGDKVDLLVLRIGGQLVGLPLSPMRPKIDYTLLAIDKPPASVALTDLICVSFARGTLITRADGSQSPIEALAAGDTVLTRDHGAQPIRWIGRATLRAAGAFAPVVIPAGTMGNAGDLIVSQHHRMFLYRRRRQPGLATAELLVQARHLVDGETIVLREGGFVDYFSLVFDRHEIIYAEGIPAESLMVNETTIRRLPPELADEVKRRFPGLAQAQHFGTEAGRKLLDEIGDAPGAPQPRGPVAG